jgi:hypothetical protein
VSLFVKPKEERVHAFLLKLLNSFSADAIRHAASQRAETRINVVTVVLVVPLEEGKLQVRDAFSAITKNVSSGGVAIVLDQPRWFEQAVIGFSHAGHMTFLRGKARYSEPLGGGFRQLGFQLVEILSPAEHPELLHLQL